ncbi:MAG: hypothetical protein JRJ03_03765 [Deltaproteobacteria bacterium]|nr:hypothetical protein [Deltaproteobacteria bacterium]
MRDLSFGRKQGEIVGRAKKKMRQQAKLSLRKKLDWYAEVYETFEQRLDDTERIFGTKRLSAMIELQKKIRSINALNKQV